MDTRADFKRQAAQLTKIRAGCAKRIRTRVGQPGKEKKIRGLSGSQVFFQVRSYLPQCCTDATVSRFAILNNGLAIW